jgi:glutamyl-tRNA synthetase
LSVDESLSRRVRDIAYKHAIINAVKHGGKADLKAVVSKIVAELPEIRKNIREYIEVIKITVEEVNRLPIEEQLKIAKENWPELLEEKREEREKELPPLKGAIQGKVVTRLAPNPDFPLHLGNARPALLSYWYAKIYSGKMILRFEDTDPRTKAPYPEAYSLIKEDLKWLGVTWDEEYIQSLRIPLFYSIAKDLIKRRGAYVDLCDTKSIRALRARGKACPHRELPVEKHLEEFDKMLEGHYGEGEAVLRVKTDLSHPDVSVRDWIAMRIIDTSKTPHPVVGDKYIVWPTYNFAAGVDDHLMGVTHILRAREHLTNTVKQKYLYDHMEWAYPETVHFGRLSLEGLVLSKSKMRKLVLEEGIKSLSDPRLGTIQALRRRGIVRDTIWKLIKDVGVKSTDAKISLVNLYALNRSIIDPIANRYMAVEDPITIKLSGFSEELEASIPIHPSRGELYTYKVKPGDIILIPRQDLQAAKSGVFRLMGMGNFEISCVDTWNETPVYVAKLHSLSYEETRKLGAPIIQWVLLRESIRGELQVAQGVKLFKRQLYLERRVLSEKPESIIQLYRVGFARVDYVSEERVVLIYTHD